MKITLAGVAQRIERWLTCEPKGHQFNSQSGHMPELWAKFPGVGRAACESQPHIDVSLPLFLPSFPSV